MRDVPGGSALRGPSRSLIEAMELLRAAANQGYAPAQYRLAMGELNGVEAELNVKGAIGLLQQAADQGYTLALRQLGRLYQGGGPVAQDDVRALMYFELAARLGDQMACGDRDELGGGLPAPAQQLAKRRAQEWLQLRGQS
jgi:hypothetical protein